ncbi:nitrogen permease regulator 2-domain-containing protein [Phascolomyces articulosus]|uniref:Nitrogen permease regulator 2-domain-containing protein n=1 Tax=Phascolomyces articulosus TaxID=60185 RepID=A0AAD5PG01_9FUNG|nr:nitrogen permease regulator 2-domain-containing protein [Phascolomyces articulosus]
MDFPGFPRIHGIFYAVFDVIKGSIVKHQVPEGSVVSQKSGMNVPIKPLIDFETIREYVIPKPQLYKRLVTISTDKYKIMGCPVAINNHEKYQLIRNEFRFNLCFVFERDAETSSYEAVVRKMARVLEVLELECDFLSQDASSESRTVQNVIEQLYEDLNSYCECQIPINASNTINLKLFPTYKNPPTVHDYEVPVCTVDLNHMMTVNWDLTVQKMVPHINGINHVKVIAELANVKPDWARQTMQHLLYYDCIIMTDIFQFTNVYAVRPEITRMLDPGKSSLAHECLEYITLPDATPPPLPRVFALYCGLQYGSSVRDWIEEHQVSSLSIDVRRFISFGVIKGLIYRVHKYPILTHVDTIHPDIIPYLDGLHHYDEICTALKCSPQELDEQLQVSSHGNNPNFEPAMLKPIEHHTKQRMDIGTGLYGPTTFMDPQQQQQQQFDVPHSLPASQHHHHHQQRARLEEDYLTSYTNRTNNNNNSNSNNSSSNNNSNGNQWSVKFIYR